VLIQQTVIKHQRPRRGIEDWRENPHLTILNLSYDLIPMEFVDVVVTEVGLIPPTSVPVVLREAQQKIERQTESIQKV
jgi:translation initiation factor eIF-2B subunit delta